MWGIWPRRKRTYAVWDTGNCVEKRKSRQWGWIDLAIFFVFACVAVAVTWPLAKQLTTSLPGNSTDSLVHYWNGWWVGQALATGESPYRTSFLFFPTGLDLVFHNFAWLNIATWLVLRSWTGGFAAYNIAILLNLAAVGFSAYALTRELTGDRRTAFVAGLIYLAWPYRLSQLDHPNLISTQWIPLFMLFLMRVLRRGRWRDGALMGLFFVLAAYTRWQQMIPVMLAGGIYLLLGAPRGLLRMKRQLLALALGAVIAIVALIPPIRMFVLQQQTQPAELLVEGEESTMQTDLLAYLTPSDSHSLFGSETKNLYRRYYADRGASRRFSPYIGMVALSLSLLGAWRMRRASLPWVVLGLLLFATALGPILRINGQLYPEIPMPYRLLEKLFVVRLLRFPDRYNMFLALPLAVLAAYGAAEMGKIAGRFGNCSSHVLYVSLGCLVAFEYLAVPIRFVETKGSSFYSLIAQDPEPYAVLNLPLGPQVSKDYMYAQTLHQHPILQGKTARFPAETFAYLDRHPLLRGLRQSNEMSPALRDLSTQLRSLADDGLRYIILHKASGDGARLRRWQRYLAIAPVFEDGTIVVYPTLPLGGHDFELMTVMTPEIGPVRVFRSTDCLSPGRPLEIDILWGTMSILDQEFNVKFEFEALDGPVHEWSFPLAADGMGDAWPEDTLAWEYYLVEGTMTLDEGEYEMTMALVDPATGVRQGDRVTLGTLSVQEEHCKVPLPSDAVRSNALFGSEMLLAGYRAVRADSNLHLTLFWRSEQRMETDYKVFVHLFDPDSSLPVVQDDAMPMRWSYPTTLWSPGEMVTDTISLSLAGVKAGEYGLAVGVYDPSSAERLPVVGEDGRSVPDGRLMLGDGILEVD